MYNIWPPYPLRGDVRKCGRPLDMERWWNRLTPACWQLRGGPSEPAPRETLSGTYPLEQAPFRSLLNVPRTARCARWTIDEEE